MIKNRFTPKNNSPMKIAALSSVALVAVMTAPLATAQTSTTANNPIDEIIVTARRKSESLQDVPGSVTAITAATIEKAGIQRAGDFLSCLLYTSPSPRDRQKSRMPSSA